MNPKLAGQYQRRCPSCGRSNELNRTLSARMSTVENSNPRVVPRYHSRLTKLTSRCCVVMVNTTSRKKNRSRKRREMVAAKMPHKTAAGRTVKPRKFLASDIGGSALQVTHPPVTPLPATKPDLAWGQYCVCPL